MHVSSTIYRTVTPRRGRGHRSCRSWYDGALINIATGPLYASAFCDGGLFRSFLHSTWSLYTHALTPVADRYRLLTTAKREECLFWAPLIVHWWTSGRRETGPFKAIEMFATERGRMRDAFCRGELRKQRFMCFLLFFALSCLASRPGSESGEHFYVFSCWNILYFVDILFIDLLIWTGRGGITFPEVVLFIDLRYRHN